VSVYPTLSPSFDAGADRKIRPFVTSSAAACAVPIDLFNCCGTAISPYLLAVLLVKSELIICAYYYTRPSSSDVRGKNQEAIRTLQGLFQREDEKELGFFSNSSG
jgi:hypothetical protein